MLAEGRRPWRADNLLKPHATGILSNKARSASRGPGAYARRVVRLKTYSKSMGATGRFLRMFGLGR